MTTMTQWLCRRRSRVLAGQLDRLPCGGWPETVQARARVLDALPLREDRRWSLEAFLAVVYARVSIDPRAADVWRMREWDEVLERARAWDRGEESR